MFDVTVLLAKQDAIWDGVLHTMSISAVAAVLAMVLGFLVAVGQKTAILPLRWLLTAYVQVFRNTPLLVQLYFFYKGLPHLGVTFSPIMCGILALSLQTAAYMAEIIRAGIEAVPREQMEGGLSLGFSRFETYLGIVVPQALGVILPPMGNQVVGLVKNSSLVAFITVPDLFFVIFEGAAEHFEYLAFFTLGIVLYMALTLLVSGLFLLLERCIPFVRVMQEAKRYG